MGLLAGRVATRERSRVPFAEDRHDERALEAMAIWDALDDPWLPRHGARLSLQGRWSLPGLGATRDYWALDGSAQGALPLGFGTLQTEARGALSGRDLPIYEQFRIGGPVLMPGAYRRGRWGEQALGGAFSYSLDRGLLRVTARAGAGGVFATRSAIALDELRAGFGLEVAYRTPVGPLLASWGRSGDTGSRFYVAVGRTPLP